MKKLLLTFCGILLCSLLTYSQNGIVYSYDGAGNRIERRVITLKTTSKTALSGENILTAIKKDDVFEEQLNERKITIYPNPTRGNVGIDISGADFNTNCQAHLYNLMGKKLMQVQIHMNTVNPIDMNNLPAATYLLVLIFDSEKLTYKIIKQ